MGFLALNILWMSLASIQLQVFVNSFQISATIYLASSNLPKHDQRIPEECLSPATFPHDESLSKVIFGPWEADIDVGFSRA